MGFMALIFGMAGLVIFFTGIILCTIGIIFLIVYLIRRKKYKGQKKIKTGFLVAAIVFFALGLPPAIAVPAFISITHNLSIDSYVNPKDYPVVNAIEKHDHGKLESLLKSGADPNETFQNIPALFWASSNTDEGVDLGAVKLLVKYKANINAKTDQGLSLVQYIMTGEIRNQDQDEICNIIKFLIDNGYDVNEKNSEGVTLLMLAASGSSSCPTNVLPNKLINLFISKGVNVNAQDDLGRTALMWECGYSYDSYGENNDATKPSISLKRNLGAPFIPCSVSDVESLINAGADVNVKNASGYTALDYFEYVENFTKGWTDADFRAISHSEDINNYINDCKKIEELLKTK